MAESKHPNLIYVFADQLRFDALGCNGGENAKTPCLDKMSEECLNLDNAVSGHPVCAPYRASLFTGKYTPSTGMVINELRINTDHRCFAHVLDDAGYETCYIGKWHLYANQLGHHYDTKNSYIPPGPDRLGFNDHFAGYNFHHEYYSPKAYYHLDSPVKQHVEGYEPDFMTDYAIGHLKRLKESGKPFAMFLSLGTPHDPWTRENVPAEYYNLFKDTHFELPKNYCKKRDARADMWARLKPGEKQKLTEWMRVYAAMTANLDANAGRLYAAIRELGLEDNTIFVFTSDHGEMFGAHGRRAKNIFFNEAVRVPFMMKWGNKIPAGRKDFCLNTVDIMPTLLSMMGLEAPHEVQGENLSGCITGSEDNEKGSLLMGTGPTALYGNGYEWRGIRNKQYTYAVYKFGGREYLYDNISDPLQMNNLAGNEALAPVKAKLKDEMQAKMDETGDEFLSCLEYKRRYVKRRIIQTNGRRKHVASSGAGNK